MNKKKLTHTMGSWIISETYKGKRFEYSKFGEVYKTINTPFPHLFSHS